MEKIKNKGWKKKDAPDDIYAPIHDYKWAQQKAYDGEHCLCSVYPDYHLVFALDRWTLRRYNSQGSTIETLEPTYMAMNSRSWRVWNWKEEPNEKQ